MVDWIIWRICGDVRVLVRIELKKTNRIKGDQWIGASDGVGGVDEAGLFIGW